jgi:transposase-like protein
MDFNFKGLPQLLKRFPDDATARHFFEQERWNGTPICPFCGSDGFYKLKDNRTYKCSNKECHKKYTVTVGTIFHSSHIPLNIWFAACYLVSSHKKGISSHQLARDLNVTQKTGWFMLHRIREMVRTKAPQKLSGVVEADETYMARKYRSDFKGISPEEVEYNLTNPIKNKGAVLGMIERGGKVITKTFADNNAKNIRTAIKNNVKKDSFLFTDESFLYRRGLDEFKHDSVFHAQREWVRGDTHTNSIENFWSIMKRGIYGIYHQVSYKHLSAYCDEFSFRFNSRKMPDNDRFVLSLREPQGRLKYSQLILNEPQKEEQYKEEKNEWD